jgi:hypothetical protein
MIVSGNRYQSTRDLAADLRLAIVHRWPSAQAFYRDRDHRTGLEVPGIDRYALSPVEIHVDPSFATDPTVQRITLVATNLTARWARRVRVFLPDVALAPALVRSGYYRLADRVAAEMVAADPFGDFEIVTAGTRSWPISHALRLFVGPWEELRAKSDDYVAMAWGWVATGRRVGDPGGRPTLPRPAVVSAAALAGALGVADLFKRAIGHSRSDWLPRFAWCTRRHALFLADNAGTTEPWASDAPEVSGPLDIGRILLAGAGAIGSAIAYIADLEFLGGDMTVLDQDVVDVTNLNRSPLFSVMDAFTESDKSVVVARYLAGRGARLTSLRGTWHEHADRLGIAGHDVWISLTNEHGAWAEIPFQLPPVVLHGTTTSGWGFSAGRHIPKVEDCTMCRMPRPKTEFRGLCAEGEIAPPQHVPVRASLPFLSVAAAALTLGELLKLPAEAVGTLPNDVAADLRLGLPGVIALLRRASPECRGCRASLSPLWDHRGGRGRHASLTLAA